MKRFFCLALFVCATTIFSADYCRASTNSGGRLEIAGDKLYIAGIGHGFHVFDISNPAKPKWIGGWNNHTCPVSVQVVDGLAYLANRTSGFEIVDASNPAAPAPIGHFSTGGDLQTVQVVGHYAYVADSNRGLDIIDVTDPKNPKLAGDFDTKGQGWSALANGEYLYAGFGGGVLRIYHLENGTNPKLVKEIPGAGSIGQQIEGNKLITQHFGRLCEMDLSDPTNPPVVADAQIGFGLMGNVFVRDPLIFLTTGSLGIGVYDLSASGKIEELGSASAGYQGWGVQVRGNYAYVTDGGANLHVFDVSNPAKPVEINRVGTENFCSQVLSLAEKSSAAISENADAITNAPPQLAAGARMTDGSFLFSLHGVPGGVYDIQASTDLIHWTVISTGTLPATGVLTIIDPDAHLFDNRFYRAIKQQ